MAAQNRVAIVTGASRGIGRAIALRLASDGFDVAINDIPAAQEKLNELQKEISDKGRRSSIYVGDVSVEEDVKNLVQNTAKELGGLDVMVANAGVCITKTFMETTVEDWDRIFSINARGIFLCYKYAAQQLIEQGRGGRIIGASSIAGKQGFSALTAYCSTKFAVRGLTQGVASELGKYNITVNAYAPGPIDTEMLAGVGEVLGGKDAFYEQMENISALHATGTPVDVAGLVSYLASPEARFVTGQTVIIDGGRIFD